MDQKPYRKEGIEAGMSLSSLVSRNTTGGNRTQHSKHQDPQALHTTGRDCSIQVSRHWFPGTQQARTGHNTQNTRTHRSEALHTTGRDCSRQKVSQHWFPGTQQARNRTEVTRHSKYRTAQIRRHIHNRTRQKQAGCLSTLVSRNSTGRSRTKHSKHPDSTNQKPYTKQDGTAAGRRYLNTGFQEHNRPEQDTTLKTPRRHTSEAIDTTGRDCSR